MSTDKKPTEDTPVQNPPEKTEEKTISEIVEETLPQGGDDKKKTPTEEVVPLAAFLELKKDNKELTKSVKDLMAKVEAGDTSKGDITDELDALAEEFDIEPKFVNKLAKIFEARAEKKVGESIQPLLEQNKKLTDKEKQDLIDAAFTKHYGTALEAMPEYKDIANADTIKALSLLPANAKKTFAQLIEETYGKAITGKRTIIETTPGGGKDPEPLDFDRAKKDTAYFEEVMKDPEKKAAYNKKMLEPRGRR